MWLRSHNRHVFGVAHLITLEDARMTSGGSGSAAASSPGGARARSSRRACAGAQAPERPAQRRRSTRSTSTAWAGRDDVAQGRLDIANAAIREPRPHGSTTRSRGFNDQAFLARLAPGTSRISCTWAATASARTRRGTRCVPLANCIANENIDTKTYRPAALSQVTLQGPALRRCRSSRTRSR